MNIFFCDIVGTYSGNDIDREYTLKDLANNLDSIIDVDNLNNLYFSFISTNHMNEVQQCMLELNSFIASKKVKFGPQFSSEHILINGKREKYTSCKLDQMMKFLENHKVEKIYYADDSLMNHKMFEYVMKKAHPEIQIQGFVLGELINTDVAIGIEEKEINGLNKLLKTYVNSKRVLSENNDFRKIL